MKLVVGQDWQLLVRRSRVTVEHDAAANAKFRTVSNSLKENVEESQRVPHVT